MNSPISNIPKRHNIFSENFTIFFPNAVKTESVAKFEFGKF